MNTCAEQLEVKRKDLIRVLAPLDWGISAEVLKIVGEIRLLTIGRCFEEYNKQVVRVTEPKEPA